nr:ribonuclease H-like domain-containing protein [Tanacetum cinerariifolium]
MDIEIEQFDLNQKFLTSLPPEWLMHTIVWRNKSDLDTMSLDDLYNYLKVYESKVQKKSESNSQNMDFISSAKNSNRKEDFNTASIPTTNTNVSPASVNIRVVSISQDTACAYIASQSSGSQIKFEDITQIDEDDMEEMDIKGNMALLSMRADGFWKKTGKKISIQGTNVEEQAPKALMAIDRVGWDWSFMANEEEDHALVADEETPTEFALMAKTSADGENKEGLGYSVVPPPQVYSPPKKYLSWTGLPKFTDDIVTDYSRPSPAIESTSDDVQNRNPSVTETEASPSNIVSKPFIKFMKATDSPTKNKADKVETVRNTTVKYAELYRKTSKKSNVRGNQRNWNNLKSQQLGKNFVMKRACYNCGGVDHLSYNCVRSQFRGPRVPNVNRKFPTVSRKFPTGNSRSSTADQENKGKAIKASACWIWKPSQNLSNKGPNSNIVSVMFKKATPITTLMTKAIGTMVALGT